MKDRIGNMLRLAALPLLLLCASAQAQNMYVSDMETWFRPNGTGYCNDVRGTFEAQINNTNTISALMAGADDGWGPNRLTGTMYYLNPVDGTCVTNGPASVYISGNFNRSSAVGTLYGISQTQARGKIDVSLYGMGTNPSGDISFLDILDIGANVYCVPTDNNGPTSEGFENGSLAASPLGWSSSGVDNWYVQASTRFAGSYAASSGNLDFSDGFDQASSLSLMIDVDAAGNVTYYDKIASWFGDTLSFYVDCVQQGSSIQWQTAWQQHSYGLSAGIHMLTWVYRKNGDGFSDGEDKAWIDGLTLPVNTKMYNGTTMRSTATLSGLTVLATDNGFGTMVANMAAQPVGTMSQYPNAVTGPVSCGSWPQSGYIWKSSNSDNDRLRKSTSTALVGTVSGPRVLNEVEVSSYTSLTGEMWTDSSLIEFERPKATYPGGCLGLCASIECAVTTTPLTFGIDDLTFEIFKFGPGANPLDASSTPPIKTISMFPEGASCSFASGEAPGRKPMGIYCGAWDGYYNLNGFFGKTNGQYGYRAKVTTRQTTNQGTSIDIEQTAAFPGQNQVPIKIDVTNIHMARSSPTAVGNLTKVPAHPYNITYRLSKDATTTIDIYDTDVSHQTGGLMTLVRTIISSQPRVGEGVPDGALTNGDFWDGRNENGILLPAGSYVARINAGTNDRWSSAPFSRGTDQAYPAELEFGLDPLQITDVGMKPLGASSTDMAIISYFLTEPATAYVLIYTPGTSFLDTNVSPPVVAPGTGSLVRSFTEEKQARQSVNTYWDGRDQAGYPVCDGDYVFAVYAELPSAGSVGDHGFSWTSIKTRRTSVGTVPVARGKVVAFLQPSSTVIGSSPSVAGLNPFYFRYTPERNMTASLRIKDMAGVTVRTLYDGEPRFSNTLNNDTWDGKDNAGLYVTSGTYLAELEMTDPYACTARSVSTTTALIPVHLFRVTDVRSTPMLGGEAASASIGYELSQTMYTELKIYPTDVTVNPAVWPPVLSTPPVFSVTGLRPGRMRITEPWDGRDSAGQLVPDGRYPYTLVAYTTGTAHVMYATDRAYGYADVSRGQILFTSFDVYPTVPTMYSSSEVVKLPPYGIDYTLTRQSSVTVQVVTLEEPQPRLMAELVKGEVRDGMTLYKDFWDGRCTATADCPHTDYVAGGLYNVRVMAQDLGGELKQRTTMQQTVDVYPIRIYDLSITPLTMDSPAIISYQVSEPMKVVTKVYKPGTSLSGPGDPPNTLVKRLIGVRPARTQISEYWDGTDLTLSKVSDGNYVFKVYGSTVTDNINTLTGDYLPGTVLADDIIISNLPVIRSGSADLCKDFSRETYFAPNPYAGRNGWFHIPALMNGSVEMKIYNLAGEQVYAKDYGLRGGGNNVDGKGNCAVTHTHEACWPRVNQAGREVAPGVYLAVIRFEATEGTRDVCQVVKKILVP